MTSVLETAAARREAGDSLTRSEAAALAACPDVIGMGELAEAERRRRHGARVTFCGVAEMTVTSVCEDQPRAAALASAGESRLVATPRTLDEAVVAVRAAAAGGGPPVTAYRLSDLERQAATGHLPLEEVLARLRDAGLSALAEADVDLLADPARALEAVVRSGMTVARATIARSERQGDVEVLLRIAALQRAVGGLRCLSPLPRLVSAGSPSTGYDDVRQVALARVLVDNIDSIQVDWMLYGCKLAQVAFMYGADDVEARWSSDVSADIRTGILADVRRHILAAGLEPVQRNGLFQVVGS